MKTKNQKGQFKITPSLPFNASTLVQTAPQLLKAFEKATNSQTVTLDLSENTTFDSGTLNLILATHIECQNRGLNLQIEISGEGEKFLHLFNLQRRMTITTQEAAE